MIFRILAAASALSLGLSVAAQAQPTLNAPAAQTAGASSAPVKPAGYRTAAYRGGAGATWKTGRDAYGFGGSYGGCRYGGHAGPGGYKIDRTC